MMRSMYSGVSGLAMHQTKMDVIGNNIANVNTLGFKASRVTFAEVFSQTMQNATSSNENRGGTNPIQVGLGGGMSSIDVNMREGASQRTDNPLDLKIKGNGFFVLKDPTGNKFSRAGAFRIDEAGNLVNPAGLQVMGWPVDKTTNKIQKVKVEPIQILNPKNMYSDPEATTDITLGGNINKNDTALTGAGVPFTMQFYDTLGYRYTAEFRITEDTAAGVNHYNLSLAADSITDSEGNIGAAAGVTNAAFTIAVEFDPATGKIVPPAPPAPATIVMTAPTGTTSEFKDLTINYNDLTLFSGNSTVEALAGDYTGVGSGSPAGSISGYEVGTDGKIIGKYTNGQTKALGQIVIANFQNPEGLQKVGDNLFVATSNSGDFDGVGQDVTSSGGSFSSGVLEMSNVDLSKEFTEMITTQRGFQANSRIITSSDELLQELVNLKR